MTESWWLCPDADFHDRAEREQARMRASKFAQWQQLHFIDLPDPRRRVVPPAYAYHLERGHHDNA